eukprot:g14810.t1
MAANGESPVGGGGNPKGGYPPPEHLHGVFAVYKPKGFTSNDVVQKIKGTLTKGLREEKAQRARSTSERSATSPGVEEQANKNEETALAEVAAAAATAAAAGGAAGPNGEGAASGGGAAEDGGGITSRKEGKKKQTRRWPRGPKVKVGHGGTLDPMATGVLVIGVGRGCRELSNYLQGSKAYRAEALLGYETDTQDSDGEATVHGEWGHVTAEGVGAALKRFLGDITQVPPMFSALHKDGQRLYELARKGITVEREARPVTVYSLRQTEPPPRLPLLGLELECGGGFYVRTLIEDLARALGTRGHMTALERTKQGPFEIEDAVHLDDWDYEHLCTYLGSVDEMTARLELLSKRQESVSESESESESKAPPVVPAVRAA